MSEPIEEPVSPEGSPVDNAVQAWLRVRALDDDTEADPAAVDAAEAELATLLDALTDDEREEYEQQIAEVEGTPDAPAEEPALTAAATGSVPWHGVLAPEGVMSGDRRKFATGSLRNRDLPLPLMSQDATAEGHDGAVRVARIDGISRSDEGHMRAWGWFDTSDNADESVRQIAEEMLRGVSVDVDDAEFSFETMDGEPVTGDEMSEEQPVMVITSGRISGATLCSIPAFQEAYVALGEPPADWGVESVGSGLAEPSEAIEMAADGTTAVLVAFDLEPGDRVQWPDGTGTLVSVDEDVATIDPDEGDEPVQVPVADVVNVGDDTPEDDGEGGLDFAVPGVMPRKLKAYWTHGEGAAKIGWGAPGDFNRCRAALAEYVSPQMLSGLCANLHKAATGEWPGKASAEGLDVSQGTALTITSHDDDALVAAAGTSPDAFNNPMLTEPTPLTITNDGRIYGHLATWGTCHVGFDGHCVTPPMSNTDYAYFTTGEVVAGGQRIPVGQITMGTGHASTQAKIRPAIEHYDNTGCAVADVAAGDDEHGIWIAGQVRSTTTKEQVAALRAGALSGDWRRVGGNLELVAALAVNVPGFPIPRVRSAQHGSRQTALVASGIVTPEAPLTVVPVPAALVDGTITDFDTIVARSIHQYLRVQRRLERAAATRTTMARLRAERAARAAAEMAKLTGVN